MKQEVKVALEDFSPSNFEGTLADLRDKINEMINEYGPTARLDYEADHWYQYDSNPSPRYFLTTYREETDEEEEDRLAREKALTMAREERDRAEFERLKKKFEQGRK